MMKQTVEETKPKAENYVINFRLPSMDWSPFKTQDDPKFIMPPT